VRTLSIIAASKTGDQVSRPIDVVSARALTDLPRLIRYAQDYLIEGAIALFPKGQDIGLN
jgi:16S rRNA G527 N7-methylase RsmG